MSADPIPRRRSPRDSASGGDVRPLRPATRTPVVGTSLELCELPAPDDGGLPWQRVMILGGEGKSRPIVAARFRAAVRSDVRPLPELDGPRDDRGLTLGSTVEIDALGDTGRRALVTITPADQRSVSGEWLDALPCPGVDRKHRSALGAALQTCGELAGVAVRELYDSTGLVRLDDGRLAFVHPGGPAIVGAGESDPERGCAFAGRRNMRERLARLKLGYLPPAGTLEQRRTDAGTLLQVADVTPGAPAVGLAILAAVAAAPLAQRLPSGAPLVLLAGLSGSFKTAVAQLALQTCSDVHGPERQPTINMRDSKATEFAFAQITHRLAGLPVLADDLMRAKASPAEQRKASTFLSSVGSQSTTKTGVDRGTWGDGGGGIATNEYPRCATIVTTEVLPEPDDASTLARWALLNIAGPEQVDRKQLTELQSPEAAHAMRRATSDYLAWLLTDERIGEALEYRERAAESYRAGGLHVGQAPTFAALEMGFVLLHRWAAELGVFTVGDLAALEGACRGELLKAAERQGEQMCMENGRALGLDPAVNTLDALSSVLRSGAGHISRPERGENGEPQHPAGELPGGLTAADLGWVFHPGGRDALGEWSARGVELGAYRPPKGTGRRGVFPYLVVIPASRWGELHKLTVRQANRDGHWLPGETQTRRLLKESGILAGATVTTVWGKRAKVYLLDLEQLFALEDDTPELDTEPEPELDPEPEPPAGELERQAPAEPEPLDGMAAPAVPERAAPAQLAAVAPTEAEMHERAIIEAPAAADALERQAPAPLDPIAAALRRLNPEWSERQLREHVAYLAEVRSDAAKLEPADVEAPAQLAGVEPADVERQAAGLPTEPEPEPADSRRVSAPALVQGPAASEPVRLLGRAAGDGSAPESEPERVCACTSSAVDAAARRCARCGGALPWLFPAKSPEPERLEDAGERAELDPLAQLEAEAPGERVEPAPARGERRGTRAPRQVREPLRIGALDERGLWLEGRDEPVPADVDARRHAAALVKLARAHKLAQIAVHPSTHARLGLPAELNYDDDGEPEPLAFFDPAGGQVDGLPVERRLAAWAYWKPPRGKYREQIAVYLPAFDGETELYTATDGRELLRALRILRDSLGDRDGGSFLYDGTPASTGGALIFARQDWPGPSGPHPEIACDGGLEPHWSWLRELTRAERRLRYVVALDVNKQYLAVCQRLNVGLGEPEHMAGASARGSWLKGGAGYYRAADLRAPDPMLPDPFVPNGNAYAAVPERAEWHPWPTIELARELGLKFTIAEAWVYPETRCALAPLYGAARSALTSIGELVAKGDTAAGLARSVVKSLYTDGIGWLERNAADTPDDDGCRPFNYRRDWVHHVHSKARCNAYRAIVRAGARPFAASADTIWLTSATSEPVEALGRRELAADPARWKPLELTGQPGKWEHMGARSMVDTLAAIEAGGLHGLSKLFDDDNDDDGAE